MHTSIKIYFVYYVFHLQFKQTTNKPLKMEKYDEY